MPRISLHVNLLIHICEISLCSIILSIFIFLPFISAAKACFVSTNNDIPTINLEAFNDLAEILEEDFYELLEDFIVQVPSQLKQLEAAIGQSDYKKIFEISHSQSGSSGNLGLSRLHTTCEEICLQAKNENIDECGKLYNLLSENFETCKILLAEKIKNH